MAFVEFENTALVELVMTQHGEIVENTLYFRGSSPWDNIELEALCEEVYNWWAGAMAPLISDTVTLTEVRGRDMSTQFGVVGYFVPTALNVGEVTSPALPNNVTVSIGFKSQFAGRRARGRNYFVGLTEGQVTGNAVIAGSMSNILAAYFALNGEVTANSAAHVIASRAAPTGTPPQGDTYYVINYTSDGLVDSQRRRLAGRGS